MPNITADSCMDRTSTDLVGLDAGKLQLSKPWRPISLVAVCRYWRDVGLNLSALWSIIDIRGAPGYSYNPSTHGKLWTYDRDSLFASGCNMRFAELSLQRSGNVPLDVVVWAPAEEDVPQLRAILTPHSRRFRAFHLYAYQPGSKLVDVISQWSMPQLQQLTLWASCGFSILNPGVFGEHTPAIKELTLSNIPYWLSHSLSVVYDGLSTAWLFGVVLGNKRFNALEFSNAPVLDELANVSRGGPRSMLAAGLQDATVLANRCSHEFAFIERQ